VTGGRNYADRAYVFRVLDEIHAETPIGLILHGACGWNGDDDEREESALRGADRWANEWGATRRVAVFALAAKWTTHGRAAGPIRNGGLAAYGADLAVAFPGGSGTADMVRKCERWGIKLRDER
jgi:hypothetical protein